MGALRETQETQMRNQFYTDSTKRMDSMKKQLDEISDMYKQQQERRAKRRASYAAPTVGQQMGGGAVGGTGLRISKGGMSPSARRRMRRAG